MNTARQPLRLPLALALALTLGACATTQNPDPLEPVNRKIFAFNEALDEAVVEPAARGYRAVTPELVRTGITNVFANFRDLWSALNNVLQGKGEAAASDWTRFATNTTLGFGGLLDWATPMGLKRYNEDFGQTLGHWGVGSGAYLVLPLFGPTSLRDVSDLPLGNAFSPLVFVDGTGEVIALSGLRIIEIRAQLLDAGQLIDQIALDKYSFVRNAFLQRRQNLVYDGAPPELPQNEERYDLPARP